MSGISSLDSVFNLDLPDPNYVSWYGTPPRHYPHCLLLKGTDIQGTELSKFLSEHTYVPPTAPDLCVNTIGFTYNDSITDYRYYSLQDLLSPHLPYCNGARVKLPIFNDDICGPICYTDIDLGLSPSDAASNGSWKVEGWNIFKPLSCD
jgi:hypothetical protein